MGLKDKIGKYRRKKSARLAVIIILLVILGALFYFWEKARLFIGALIITMLIALGLEVSGNDWDLGKLAETGSFKESKIEQTESGHWLIGEECQKEKLNCDNFTYQEDAQDLFEKCGGLENDVHDLDRDNDNKVCEHLPSKT